MRIVTAGMMMLATAAALHAQEPSAGVLPQVKIVTGGTFGFISEQLVGGTPVKGAPYSAQAVTETTQVLADGNRISRKNVSMVARDSEGRTRREENLSAVGPWSAEGQSHTMVFINDPVAQANYVLDATKHSAN